MDDQVRIFGCENEEGCDETVADYDDLVDGLCPKCVKAGQDLKFFNHVQTLVGSEQVNNEPADISKMAKEKEIASQVSGEMMPAKSAVVVFITAVATDDTGDVLHRSVVMSASEFKRYYSIAQAKGIKPSAYGLQKAAKRQGYLYALYKGLDREGFTSDELLAQLKDKKYACKACKAEPDDTHKLDDYRVMSKGDKAGILCHRCGEITDYLVRQPKQRRFPTLLAYLQARKLYQKIGGMVAEGKLKLSAKQISELAKKQRVNCQLTGKDGTPEQMRLVLYPSYDAEGVLQYTPVLMSFEEQYRLAPWFPMLPVSSLKKAATREQRTLIELKNDIRQVDVKNAKDGNGLTFSQLLVASGLELKFKGNNLLLSPVKGHEFHIQCCSCGHKAETKADVQGFSVLIQGLGAGFFCPDCRARMLALIGQKSFSFAEFVSRVRRVAEFCKKALAGTQEGGIQYLSKDEDSAECLINGCTEQARLLAQIAKSYYWVCGQDAVIMKYIASAVLGSQRVYIMTLEQALERIKGFKTKNKQSLYHQLSEEELRRRKGLIGKLGVEGVAEQQNGEDEEDEDLFSDLFCKAEA